MKPIQLEEIPIEIKDQLNNIHSITFPRQGCTSDVGIIESDSGRYALKRTKTPQFNAWLKKEIMVLRSLNQETSLPVPKVEKFVEQNEQSWALLGFLKGETMRAALAKTNQLEKREELLFQFGKTVAVIHSTSCPAELQGEETWLDLMLKQADYNMKNYQVDGSEELLKQITSYRPTHRKPTLIHGDLTVDNVLVHNGVVTGIIDWSGGAFGDPRYDVSLAIRPKPDVFMWERDKEIFMEGYGENILNDGDYDYFINLYEYF